MPKCILCYEEFDSPQSSPSATVCPKCNVALQMNQTNIISPSPPAPTLRTAFSQPGWVCPKCGSVYSPHTGECWRCNPPTVWQSKDSDLPEIQREFTF